MTATPQGEQNMAYDCAHFHKENVYGLSLLLCLRKNRRMWYNISIVGRKEK